MLVPMLCLECIREHAVIWEHLREGVSILETPIDCEIPLIISLI